MKTLASFKALVLAAAGTLVLAACSGGGSSAPAAIKSSGSGGSGTTTPSSSAHTVATNWIFKVPAKTASAATKKAASGTRSPKYVTADIATVTITLDSVTPGGIPSGLQTSVTTTISAGSCANGCSVAGPSVPPGSDTFTLTTYDANGNVISTASPTYSIAAGSTNTESVTLNGVPASIELSFAPTTAGTPYTGIISVTVIDVDGNTILGTYDNPVTIGISDTTGATILVTSGSDNPTNGTLLSSRDVAALAYTGLAIAPATITASATGVTATLGFAPQLSPIVYSGPENSSSQPEIDLYAATGTGSSATFTATEVGWTNSPYNKAITATEAAGCVHIATTAATNATTFLTSVSTNAPAAGTCTLTLTDFTGGNSTSVTLTNTTSSFGVN